MTSLDAHFSLGTRPERKIMPCSRFSLAPSISWEARANSGMQHGRRSSLHAIVAYACNRSAQPPCMARRNSELIARRRDCRSACALVLG